MKLRLYDTDAPIDEQIANVLQTMTAVGVTSDEYPKYMDYLERLNKIKAHRRRNPVSRDMMIQVFGNIAITLIIVAYEEKHVITSKAFGQLLKGRAEA